MPSPRRRRKPYLPSLAVDDATRERHRWHHVNLRARYAAFLAGDPAEAMRLRQADLACGHAGCKPRPA